MQNNKQKIYISTYDDIKNPHYGGGGAIAVHEIAKRLLNRYDVRILSWDYGGKKKEIIDKVIYERFGIPSLNPKFAMFVYQIALPFIAMGKKYDVWCESFCPPFTTSFMPLFVKKPIVGLVHMLAAEDMERKYKLPFHVIQNKGIKTYKHIIVTSGELRKAVKEITPSSSIAVISNGIPKVFTPQKRKEKYILFLGRIEVDQKGIDLLIKAFAQFSEHNASYKLVIAGSGDPKEIVKMQKLIKESSIAKRVSLKGKVTGKIKEKLLREAACVVIPSRFETYSLVALEAMGYGAPIICFSINGLSWISDNIAIKVKPFDVDALTKGFDTVTTNKDKVSSMINNGNVYAKQFTWDSIAKKYDEFLHKINTSI